MKRSNTIAPLIVFCLTSAAYAANTCFDVFAKTGVSSTATQTDSDVQRQLNLRMYFKNLYLSRTASLGKSSKSFNVSPDEAREIARKNALKAFSMADKLAHQPRISSEALFGFLVDLNRIYNEGLVSTSGHGTAGLGGEFRKYTLYAESDVGITPEQLPELLPKKLKALTDELSAKLSEPMADPYTVAAWAHNRFTIDIKPFHDANGRTGRALIDIVMMRAGLPLPWYFGEMNMSGNQGQLTGDYAAALQTDDGFRRYVFDSVQRSIDFIRNPQQFDLDIKSKADLKKIFEASDFDWDHLAKVRLQNGQVIQLGRRLGRGQAAVVYCVGTGCTEVIKIPINQAGLESFEQEIARGQLLAQNGFLVPQTRTNRSKTHLIKEKIAGALASELRDRGQLNEAHIHAFARMYKFMQRTGIPIDIDGSNLIWSEAKKDFYLIDTGMWAKYENWYKSVDAWKHYYFANDPRGFQRFQELIASDSL